MHTFYNDRKRAENLGPIEKPTHAMQSTPALELTSGPKFNRPMKIQQISASEHILSNWPGGSTTQLAIYPPGADLHKRDFLARISSADISSSGPFSKFDGFTRVLMLLSGDGVRLTFSDGTCATLRKPFEKTRFDGSLKTDAELLGDSVKDFNLILGRGVGGDIFNYELSRQEQLLHLASPPAAQSALGQISAAATIVYAFDGEVSYALKDSDISGRLSYGDCLKIDHAALPTTDLNLTMRSITPFTNLIVAKIYGATAIPAEIISSLT